MLRPDDGTLQTGLGDESFLFCLAAPIGCLESKARQGPHGNGRTCFLGPAVTLRRSLPTVLYSRRTAQEFELPISALSSPSILENKNYLPVGYGCDAFSKGVNRSGGEKSAHRTESDNGALVTLRICRHPFMRRGEPKVSTSVVPWLGAVFLLCNYLGSFVGRALVSHRSNSTWTS